MISKGVSRKRRSRGSNQLRTIHACVAYAPLDSRSSLQSTRHVSLTYSVPRIETSKQPFLKGPTKFFRGTLIFVHFRKCRGEEDKKRFRNKIFSFTSYKTSSIRCVRTIRMVRDQNVETLRACIIHRDKTSETFIATQILSERAARSVSLACATRKTRGPI